MNARTEERPILFNAPMVRAILDGRKTQTRRVVKPQPANGWALEEQPVLGRITSEHPDRGRFGVFIRQRINTDYPLSSLIPCPHGAPGDLLWVRETFGHEVRALGGTQHEKICYRATNPNAVRCYDCNGGEIPMKWTPSIHMPRWASRILLRVTDVRVERLREISEADAIAEGVSELPMQHQVPGAWWSADPTDTKLHSRTSRGAFRLLWESINGAESWDANPWVWVIEFERVKP